MESRKVYRAIGLMSGTSLDGVDAALLETDGYDYVRPLSFVSFPYHDEIRNKLRACLRRSDRNAKDIVEAAQEMTLLHFKAIQALSAPDVEIIGFHGQTIFHDPANKVTVQVGDPALLAAKTGIDVVFDFRSADVAAGGQGAPLAPLYHRARVRASKLKAPVVILNIGGISNVTWIGPGENDILAFDTGPGNALIDDWVNRYTNFRFDENGAFASKGKPDQTLLKSWMKHEYFTKKAPKSLDRDAWKTTGVEKLTVENGAATLTEFTVQSIAAAAKQFPAQPTMWLVTGGGRRNSYLIRRLKETLKGTVKLVDDESWNGDALEAECFGYLAVRSLLGESLSVPGTTGVPKPLTGGTLYKARP